MTSQLKDCLNETLKNYIESHDTLVNYRQMKINELRYYDQAVCDFYHLIEFGKFPAHILAQIHKKFSIVLRERRYLKNVLISLKIIDRKMREHGLDVYLSEIPTHVSAYTSRAFSDIFVEYKRYLPKSQKIDIKEIMEDIQ